MAQSAFSQKNSLIAYGADWQAVRVPELIDALGNAETQFIVGFYDFTDDDSVHADHWERHPAGDEILCALEGRLLVTIDGDGATEEAVIENGQAFIVPRGRWHRLRVLEPGRLLFVGPTAGSELRPHAAGEGRLA